MRWLSGAPAVALSPAARRVLALCALAAALCAAPRGLRDRYDDRSARGYIAAGEALLHGLPREGSSAIEVSYNAPLASVSAALLYEHGGSLELWWRWPAFLAALALTVSLGALLGSPFRGAVAAAALAALFPGGWFGASEFTQAAYTLLVLTCACFCVWRARAPGPVRSAAAGLAFAAAVLFRSAAAFFPLALAALERFGRPAGRGRVLAGRRGWLAAAALCLLPCAGLLPWIAMNFELHGAFIPFEHRRADPELVAGALGALKGLEADSLESLVEAEDDKRLLRQGRALFWAGREVLRHPLRYAWACARRVGLMAALALPLFLLAAWSAWVRRGDAGYRVLAALCAYWVLVHAALAYEDRYLEPLWPLLAVLAAGVLPDARPGAGSEREPGLPGLAAPAAALACALALSALANAAVLRYRALAAAGRLDGGRLPAELARRPGHPWLERLAAERELFGGRPEAAARRLARALRARPRNLELAFEHARALALCGRFEPILRYRTNLADDQPRLRAQAWAAAALCLRRRADCPAAFARLRASWESEDYVRVGMPWREPDRSLLARLRAEDHGYRSLLAGLLQYPSAPAWDRSALIAALRSHEPRLDSEPAMGAGKRLAPRPGRRSRARASSPSGSAGTR